MKQDTAPQSSPPLTAAEAVEHALHSWGAESLEILSELAGGASTRRFFRVRWKGQTAIAMYTPAPSQEIAKARQTAGPAPFIEVAALLSERGVRVPQIYTEPTEHNMLLVEDLGDDTLANYLRRHPERKEALYQRTILDLAEAQKNLEQLPDNCIVLTRAFDKELLRWEVDHFHDWVLEARGVKLSAEDHEVFARAADYMASTISSWPRGYTHRDFQSRNLMVQACEDGETLTWIDFQDGMMGPRAYDLVALLTDSYQSFTREFIEQRLQEYCNARGIPDELERVTFEFDFITVQRKLKDAGRFIFIDRVNKNPHFLKYVDSTIEKARAALHRVGSEGPLKELEALLDRVL